MLRDLNTNYISRHRTTGRKSVSYFNIIPKHEYLLTSSGSIAI